MRKHWICGNGTKASIANNTAQPVDTPAPRVLRRLENITLILYVASAQASCPMRQSLDVEIERGSDGSTHARDEREQEAWESQKMSVLGHLSLPPTWRNEATWKS